MVIGFGLVIVGGVRSGLGACACGVRKAKPAQERRTDDPDHQVDGR